MRNAMVIMKNNGRRYFHICFGGYCKDGDIPVYHSIRHAVDVGWGYSSNPAHLPKPGWLCPDCMGNIYS